MRNFQHIYLIIGIAIIAMLLPVLLGATYQSFQGVITENTLWGLADTLKVTGNVTVNNGVTLTMLPGLKVVFQGHYYLNIQGRLLAEGTAGDRITFTAKTPSTGWNRLTFDQVNTANDSSKVVYCNFEYSKANGEAILSYGGAIFVSNFNKLLVSNCLFQNNTAGITGGAIYCGHTANIKILDSVFTQNTASMGGALTIYSNALLKNLLIYNNTSTIDQYGGGILFNGLSATVLNCTIVNNQEAGVKCNSFATPVFRNCLIWGNTSYDVTLSSGSEPSNPDFYYCDVEGGLTDLQELGTAQTGGYVGDWVNSFATNPQFVGSGGNPYDLQITSPCVNAGDPATTLGTVGLYDIGGGSRILNGRIDMGAYEELIPVETIAGNALEFDGAGDYVSGTGISTSLSAFTIEAWVYHNSLPGVVQRYITLNPEVAVLRYDGTIYGGYRALHFYIKRANGSGYGIIEDSLLVTGEWMHIAGTYDGTNMKLYVNGRLVKSAAPGGGLYAPSGSYSFSGSGETFDGKLDEMRIWNYARTEAQIRENMHLPLNGGEPGLKNYWQFNASSGTTVSEIVSGCTGNTHNMNDQDWVNSCLPFGSGVVNTQNESAGTMVFTGVGLTLNYTSHGTASITATKLNCAPNLLPPDAGDYFDSQYWIVERYGTGTFNANMELFPTEDLTTTDQSKPYMIKLFTREGNSDGEWTLITSAYTVSDALNVARFTGLSSFSQFLIARIANQIDTSSGNALSFDGIDDYVNLGNASSLGLSNIVTIEAWIKPTNLTGRQGIFSTRFNNAAGSFQLEVGTGSGGTNRVAVSGINTWVAQTGDNAITPGVWNHIAYVRSGPGAGTHSIYVNGVLQTLISDSSYAFTANNNDKVLGSGTSGGQPYNGLIDEVRVWEVVLSADKIRETMYLPLSSEDSGLLSYWQFNELSGSQLKDGISSNNGTLVNMDNSAWTGSTIPFSPGAAYSENEAMGFIDFPGTDLSMDFALQNSARITATRLDATPVNPPQNDTYFFYQYWIVNRYGTSDFSADMTFHPQEDLSYYEGLGCDFKLYNRPNTSEGEWSSYSGGVIFDYEANTITFHAINTDGQFLIAFAEASYLAAPQNVQLTKNGANIHLSWDAVVNANVYNVYSTQDPSGIQDTWHIIAYRHPATTWDVPIEMQAEFYKIIASDQGVELGK